jgi:hypothetical protein
MAALKRITQETFDEVVKENEEEFEMDRAEALAEAVKQFKSQGVSLENIDVTGGVGRAEVEAAMDGLVAGGQGVLGALSELSVLCDASHELGARNRTLMISYKSAAALNALHALVAPSQVTDILVQAMKLLKTMCKNSIEARDFFEPNGSQNLVSVMRSDEHGGDGTAQFTKTLPNLFNFSICGSTMGAFEGPRSIVRKVPPSDESQAWLYLNEAVDLISERRPQLVIYQAGMDPHRNDPLSHSKMSGEFLAKRDEFVMETLPSRTIPFFFVLAGGYQEPMEEKLVPLHVRTFEIAAKLKHRAALGIDH